MNDLCINLVCFCEIYSHTPKSHNMNLLRILSAQRYKKILIYANNIYIILAYNAFCHNIKWSDGLTKTKINLLNRQKP